MTTAMKLNVFALLSTALTASAAMAEEPKTGAIFPLQKNDVIYVLGDSTTVEGGGPTGYVTLMQQAINEQAKDANVLVIARGGWGAPSEALVGSGVKGGAMKNALDAKTKDGRRTTAIIINYGLNDSKGGERAVEPFGQNLRKCVEMAREAKVRIMLCTPMTWRGLPTAPLAEMARKVAKEMNVPLVDLQAVHVAQIEKNTKDGKLDPAANPTKDGVHLSSLGNKLTATALLEALGYKGEWKSYRVIAEISGPNRRVAVKGKVVLEPAKDFYAPGEKVTVRAVPDEGFKFVEWRDAATGSENPITVTGDRPMRFHALLEPIAPASAPAAKPK